LVLLPVDQHLSSPKNRRFPLHGGCAFISAIKSSTNPRGERPWTGIWDSTRTRQAAHWRW
jgi:hypothetical protein